MKEEVYYSDYPNEPIGGGNPYYKCSLCGISDPQINGSIEGHLKNCPWRIQKELEIKNKNKGNVV